VPIHEYRCQSCGQLTSFFFRSFRAAEAAASGETPLRCPHCGTDVLQRLISKPALLRGHGGQLAEPAGSALMDALDAEDPAALAGLLRHAGRAIGEDVESSTSEMGEIIGRLEAGESPAQVGAALPDAPPAPPASAPAPADPSLTAATSPPAGT
jgi:putative FmdB family regulatory protein